MTTPTLQLYLDDSGSRFPDKKPSHDRHDGMDHFAIGGMLIQRDRLGELIQSHKDFTAQFGITYPLHSHSIRVKKKNFSWLQRDEEKANAFFRGMNDFIAGLPIKVIACCVHRPGYNDRYSERYGSERWKLCKSAYVIAVEHAAKYAMSRSCKLEVFIEQSGGAEDKAIKGYHRSLIETGMPFNPITSQKYAPLGQSSLLSVLMKNPNFITKSNRAGQIADIVLHPVIKGRYDRSYPPYGHLIRSGLLIDSELTDDEKPYMGIKYYCFDGL